MKRRRQSVCVRPKPTHRSMLSTLINAVTAVMSGQSKKALCIALIPALIVAGISLSIAASRRSSRDGYWIGALATFSVLCAKLVIVWTSEFIITLARPLGLILHCVTFPITLPESADSLFNFYAFSTFGVEYLKTMTLRAPLGSIVIGILVGAWFGSRIKTEKNNDARVSA